MAGLSMWTIYETKTRVNGGRKRTRERRGYEKGDRRMRGKVRCQLDEALRKVRKGKYREKTRVRKEGRGR